MASGLESTLVHVLQDTVLSCFSPKIVCNETMSWAVFLLFRGKPHGFLMVDEKDSHLSCKPSQHTTGAYSGVALFQMFWAQEGTRMAKVRKPRWISCSGLVHVCGGTQVFGAAPCSPAYLYFCVCSELHHPLSHPGFLSSFFPVFEVLRGGRDHETGVSSSDE